MNTIISIMPTSCQLWVVWTEREEDTALWEPIVCLALCEDEDGERIVHPLPISYWQDLTVDDTYTHVTDRNPAENEGFWHKIAKYRQQRAKKL